MAETTSTPDATGTSSRSDLLARFDGATWTPEDALLLWSFLANGTGAQSLAHLFEFLKNDFLRAAATVMAGNDTTEREALRLIVAGDYYQASNRLDEVFFVAPKESRSVVLRRQAALLGPVIPSTATVALKAAADLAPGDRLSRWTLGLLLEQLGKLDEATRYLEQLLGLELVAERHSDGALTQVALARIAGKQGNTELDATRLREAAGLHRTSGEKAETDADKLVDQAAATRSSLDEAVKAYEMAGNAFQSAADLYTRIGDDIGAASSLNDLAYTCLQRGLHAEAEAHAQRAVELYTAAGDEAGSVWALFWLAKARARRDVGGAEALLRRGLDTARKHGLMNAEQSFRETLSSGDKPASTDQVTAPAPGQPAVNSREYFRDRILTRKLTENDATAIWRRLSEMPEDGDAVLDLLFDNGTRVDFVGVITAVVPQADELELGAVAMLSSGEFDDAAEVYEQVVARTSDDNKAYKLGHFGALFAPSRPEIARRAWERMLKLNPGFNSGRLALARVLERLEDPGAAAAQYRAVISNAGDDARTETQALEKLSSLEQEEDDCDDAADYARRALAIHRRLNDGVGAHRVLLQLSDIAEEDEDLEAAVEHARQSLEVAMESGNVAGAATSLLTFDWLAEDKDLGTAAETMIERSIDWFVEQKAIPQAADAAMLLGEIDGKRGQLERADHFYERSRKVSQDNDHHRGTARAFGALGILRMNEKDYDHADWYFKTASKLYEDAGEPAASAKMLERRGINFYESGNREEARRQFDRALAAYTKGGRPKAAQRLRESMAAAGIS